MTRNAAALCVLTLAGITTASWLGSSRTPASAQSAPNVDAANATMGAASTSASDGQGSVVITYPNGILAIVKPANLQAPADAGKPRAAITLFRLHAGGVVERLTPPAPGGSQ